MSIEEAYNSWAFQYDTDSNKTRDLDRKTTIDLLKNEKFKNVLEIGCGTGKNTEWLLTKAEKIIAIDFSTEMLNVAKKKISDDRVIFKKMDLTKIWDVDDQFADLITCNLTLEHIEDLNHIFHQANIKSKEEGLFLVSELHPYKQYNGSKARFEKGNSIIELEVFTHHITDYLESAADNGFKLILMKEWFDNPKRKDIPRLISFIFKKKKGYFSIREKAN